MEISPMANATSRLNHTKNEPSEQSSRDGSITLSDVKTSQTSQLGSIAKFASHAQNKDRKDAATIQRFKLQVAAKRLLPTKRIYGCLQWLVPGAQDVEVYHVPERDSAHFHNLRTCDSVWDCPVCAAKITERRRVELMLAIARAYEDGLTPVLVTYTLRHHRGDKLEDLLKALKSAHRAMKSGRAFQSIKENFGWVGSVTATEVTNGHGRDVDNGWHPHLHELVFLSPISASKFNTFEATLRQRWEHVLSVKGFTASWEHGLTVKDSDAAVIEYVAKWGHEPQEARWTVERELTKAPTKTADSSGCTPFQLLELYLAGDKQAGALFVEYSAVFHGRAQLVWSRGLRDLLQMEEEKSDEETAAGDEEGAILLASIDKLTWWRLLNLPRDVRGELLVVACEGDAAKFARHIAELLGDEYQDEQPLEDDMPREKITCSHCLLMADFIEVGIDDTRGKFYLYECPTCGNFVRDFYQTSMEVVQAEIAKEGGIKPDDREPFKMPEREEAVEKQLGLFPDKPTVWY